jgi:hypothetical protein
MNWLDEMEHKDVFYHSYPDSRICCLKADVWFDRNVCPCGVLHERCMGCGHAVDGCTFND